MMTRNRQRPGKGTDKSAYNCTHCDQTGHSKDRCYELVGYPEWWDHSRAPKKRGSKNAFAAAAETNANDDNGKMGLSLVTTTNIDGKALNISAPVLDNIWIIDSGATNLNRTNFNLLMGASLLMGTLQLSHQFLDNKLGVFKYCTIYCFH